MFIKLTRLDNTPIWINASFIVTIEPRRDGGATVVPIGDGLDYDVKEKTETVLGLLDGVPAPEVVPVPAPPGLAPKSMGVEPDAKEAPAETVEAPAAPTPRKTASRTRAKAKTATSSETSEESADADAAEKPAAKKTSSRKAKKPPLPLSDDELARLRKQAPRTVRKLQNALAAQFKTDDAEAAIAALAAHEILSLDGERITWR